MTAPAISVVMSVYNGQRWVGDAVNSILTQTWRNFEFIVINDGSTDGTLSVLRGLQCQRLHLESWSPRRGLTRQLRRAMMVARAPLIARLDADDVADPTRLDVQHQFMAEHPEVGLLGTGALEVADDGNREKISMPCDDAAIRRVLIRANPFIHSSVMFRRAVYDQVGGYDQTVSVAQDYDLWMRMARVTKLANLPHILVTRRQHPQQISVTRARGRRLTEAKVRWRAVRQGQYPWWCAAYALKPLIGLALSRSHR